MSSTDESEKPLNEYSKHYIAMLDKILVRQTQGFAVLPPSLHHFGRARTAIISILKSREMWASHAYDMADKREVWHGADIAKQRIELFRQKYANRSVNIDRFLNVMTDVTNPFTSEWSGENDVYVVSLTEDDQSEFHWKNYADGYKGFCLDFKTDVSKWKEVMDASNIMLIRVTYNEQEQIQLIDDILESTISYILNAPVDNTLFGNPIFGGELSTAIVAAEVLKYYIVAFKQGKGYKDDYTPENEWRLVYGIRIMPHPFAISVVGEGPTRRRFARIKFDGIDPLLVPIGIRVGAAADKREHMRYESLEQCHFQDSKLRKPRML
jgi:hypothetical protein